MAITKIHPIKKTLKKSIDYITNGDKTDEKVLVSSAFCVPETAHLQFMNTRKQYNTKGTVLAHHLIQSFYPGEVTPEKAHQIGLELAKQFLKDQHQLVIATHVDRGHIHNHIIFSNVNHVTGKCYQSTPKTYHNIRTKSDNLCKKNNLIVIDEYYHKYSKLYKSRGKNWYEYQQAAKGKSWKSKIQRTIDKAIYHSTNFDEFLEYMDKKGIEITQGHHITFRFKDHQKRATRGKTIGPDYTETLIKQRIIETERLAPNRPKLAHKPINRVIDINNNDKIKNSPGYEFWATKHNLQSMADTLTQLRKDGYQSREDLEAALKNNAKKIQDTLTQNKQIEQQLKQKSKDMENLQTIIKYKQIYDTAKKNPNDKAFQNEYRTQIKQYRQAVEDIFEHYDRLPSTKNIYQDIENLNNERTKLLAKLEEHRQKQHTLYQYKNNYDIYLGKEKERKL